ncbi:MAG: CDP-archaeol synthase [Clostridiales bacterium]|nr:CDP-archaeol synthase [Clostridiales bacterium]
MAIRTAAGFVLLAITFSVIFFAPVWAFPIAVSLISAFAVLEILHSTGFIRKKLLLAYAVIISALIPIWVFFDEIPEFATLGLFLFVFLLFIDCLTESQESAFERISGIFFSSTVIPFFLSSTVRLFDMENGRVLVLIPIISAFGSDVFAYLVGGWLGKNKLCPQISPNKTVEGSIGGLLMAPVVTVLYGVLLQYAFHYQVNYIGMVLYGLAGAFAGQVGDLAMSYVKRQFHIKDFGNVIPGHGGILDRFDSVLFAAPLTEILILILPAVAG